MMSRLSLLLVVVLSSFTIGLLADMPDGGADLPPVELIRNSGFDSPIDFQYWLGDTSELTTVLARSAPNSAHLKNSKTYFYQKVLSWTPAGCYDISFYARNYPVSGEIGFTNKNRLDVDFNQEPLIGNEWSGANAGVNIPLKYSPTGISFDDWKFYRFHRCITPDEEDEHSDLRIRFAGAGYLIDDVSIVGPYCQAGSNFGFETGDFSCWTTSGPNLDAINVKCGQAPLSGEGNCYAEISTLGTGPATDPNQIERSDVAVQNTGATDKTYNVCFKYRMATLETKLLILIFGTNDLFSIRLRDAEGVVVAEKTIRAFDVANFIIGGQSNWAQACVPVVIPAGKTLFAKITAKIANQNSEYLQSFGFVDAFSFLPAP